MTQSTVMMSAMTTESCLTNAPFAGSMSSPPLRVGEEGYEGLSGRGFSEPPVGVASVPGSLNGSEVVVSSDDDAFSNASDGNRSVTESVPLARNPQGSLLQLAFKLRAAHDRVWGAGRARAEQAVPRTVDSRVRLRKKLKAASDKLWTLVLQTDLSRVWEPADYWSSDDWPRPACSLWGVLAATREAPESASAQQVQIGDDAGKGAPPALDDAQLECIVGNAVDCVLRTKMPKLLARHTEGQSTERVSRVHKCPSCSYQTANKSHLRRHQGSVHSTVKPYACFLCQQQFARTEKLKVHFAREHAGVVYQPKLCRNSMPIDVSPPLPVAPLETPPPCLPPPPLSHAEPAGACVAEDAFTVVVGDRSMRCEREERAKRYACPHCAYVGRDTWHLRRHLSDVHSTAKAFSCVMCRYSTSRRHRLLSHLRAHGRLSCPHCRFSTADALALDAHVRACTEHFSCPRCSASFPNHRSLYEHALRCSAPQPDAVPVDSQRCDACQLQFDDPEALRRHLVSCSTGSGTLTCPLCRFTTPHHKVMQRHLARHPPATADANLACDVAGCTFRATQKSVLQQHLRLSHRHLVATGESNTYPCPICVRPPFKYRRSLEKHIAAHREQRVTCTHCTATFYLRVDLDIHIANEHSAPADARFSVSSLHHASGHV